MDLDDLPKFLDPIIEDKTDISKGNRLLSGKAWEIIPRFRYLGNATLTLLTKIASGYWHITDSQSGYIVMKRMVIEKLQLDNVYKKYGFPNSLLIHFNIYNFRVQDISIEPIYNVGETSHFKIRNVVFRIAFMLLRGFMFRMREKYVIRDFHPLVFFYLLAFLLFGLDFILFARLVYYFIINHYILKLNSLAFLTTTIAAFQFLLFAMWFDMEYNQDLKPKY